jgi:Na+-driven multidrug efflux pump
MFRIFNCSQVLSISLFMHVVVGDVANIILDPIFIFMLKMGVSGAAIAHVISQ